MLPWSYSFIESLYRNVILEDHGFLLLAEMDDKIIAGSMYFLFKDTTLLKINASIREYAQYRPNYLLTWEAIKRAFDFGCRYFDFGITDLDNEGLLSFKRQWAANETEAPYYYFPSIKGTNSLPGDSILKKSYMAFCERAPAPILKITAEILNKHLG